MPRSLDTRIAKLRALARDQAGTPEGRIAARLARKLVHDNARRHASRRYQGLPDTDGLTRHRLALGGSDAWRRRLVAAVARHVGCVAAWPRGADHAFVFGHASAAQVGDYLYEVLSREVAGSLQHWLRTEAPMLGPAEARADPEDTSRRTAFCQSAVTAIDARLTQYRAQEEGEDPVGTALVLDRRTAAADWMKEQGVDTVPPAQRPWRHSPAGYLAGYRIPLHDAVTEEAAEAVPPSDSDPSG